MGFNDTLKMKFGFKAQNGKYLTVDSFGGKIHATSTDMKKKQIFTVDQYDGYVHLIAPNGKFVTAGQKGELAAEADAASDDAKWVVAAAADGTWALKSKYDYYLCNSSGEDVTSFGRAIDATTSFKAHLAIHPQVNLQQPSRKSYVHFEKNQLSTNEAIPWGVDALINLGYHDGRYSLQACNSKYLKQDGTLSDTVDDTSLYVLVFVGEKIAFKASSGKYLQSSGADGKMMHKSTEAGANELYTIEDSHPQVTLGIASKFVTCKTAPDVKANADTAGADTEVFQMEIDKSAASGGKWSFRNHKGAYWTCSGSNISEGPRDDSSWFEVTWLGDCIALKASNGKFVGRKPNAALVASFDAAEESSKFFFTIINRPQLILRSDFGFCGMRDVKGKPTFQCNMMTGDTFALEVKSGCYAFKIDGKYLKLESEGSLILGDSAEFFYIELPVHTKMAIKSSATGRYLKSEQTGVTKCTAIGANTDTEYWEY